MEAKKRQTEPTRAKGPNVSAEEGSVCPEIPCADLLRGRLKPDHHPSRVIRSRSKQTRMALWLGRQMTPAPPFSEFQSDKSRSDTNRRLPLHAWDRRQ
jgi:hypothetical protein